MTMDLYVGRKRSGISVEPDPFWAGMWRIHQNDNVSDMVNLDRAKDAAITWLRPPGSVSGTPKQVLSWKHRR